MTSRRWLPAFAACFLVLLGAAAVAQSPAQKARLDAAVRDHAEGRLEAARGAFEALARERVPAALYNLGVMHLRRELPQSDPATAERLLAQAAGLGFVTAMFTLGQAHELGELGARDPARACDWYEQAARRGSVEAQVAMGTAHYLGRGRPRDAASALDWYRRAAQGGDVGAMYLVASMYEQGDGAATDLRLARYWYAAAAAAGDEAAPLKLKDLDARLAAQPS